MLLRAGLASLLERSGFAVAGQAGDTEELLDPVRTHAPAPAIREKFPHIAILLLPAHIEVEHAIELLASGYRVGYLLKSRVTDDPLAVLSPRERELLALMAEGGSNTGIARQLWVTKGTVRKHVHSILTKLALPETDDDHRRVLAVVRLLEAR